MIFIKSHEPLGETLKGSWDGDNLFFLFFPLVRGIVP
jgi:hypothetical protein